MKRLLIFSFIISMIIGCGGDVVSPYQIKEQREDVKIIKKNNNIANPYQIKEEEKLTIVLNYLVKQELFGKQPQLPQKPQKPQIPSTEELIKGKYEKTADFEARVASAKQKRVRQIEILEKEYAKEVQSYNDEMKKITAEYNNQVAIKQKNIKNITLNAMTKAYSTVYGEPYLENSLKYDTENERFYGKIKSSKGGFSESVAIDVPIDKAENFEKNQKYLKTKVIFDYADEKLVLKKIVLENKNESYIAMVSDTNYKSENIKVAINNGSLSLPATPLLSSSLGVSSQDYQLGAINYSKDPEIAKLQKQKFELEQRVVSQKNSKLKEDELKKQKESLETQIALLEQKSGGFDDIAQLLKDTQAKNKDSTKWLFVVGIENYEFTNSVPYSSNSAKGFVSVMQKRLGILDENTRVLINGDATSAKIDYKLQDMLRHLNEGDTIYFYYSGHGIPVPSQDNAPYMLAQDMNPAYLSDERFKLQNIYKSLSNSKASKIIAFVDSCFSGGTDNQTLIQGVAATRIKPKRVSFDTTKMVVISAGSGTQYSNKYDEKSNRLFSYFVMKGLLSNNTNTQRLYDYVKSSVQEKSYEMGSSYEQVPVYDGNIKLKL